MHKDAGERLLAPVNKILPSSVVDGPGNRCAIFFQGCGFHCAYCHNPETIGECNGCGSCLDVCPTGALKRGGSDQTRMIWEQELCCGCDACLRICPNSSSPRIRQMSVLEVLEEIRMALPFIQGITVSGGECTLQEAFVTELFTQVKRFGKTAFVDTNGQRDFRKMEALTEIMDKAMLDVKAWDEEAHIRLTGVSGQVVRENLEYLGAMDKLYEVRTVIVPGFLPNEETVREVSKRLREFPGVRYKLIRFRTFGVKGKLKGQESPAQEEMERLAKLARENGIKEVIIT